VAKSGPYGNAMVRTTTALTQIGASDAPNVLPHHVWANVNFRINPGFTYEALRVFVQEMVGREIEVELPIKSNPSRPASIETPAYRAIGECIRQTFGEDIVVAPLAFFAGTDSRMFDIVSDNVYKFMPAMSHMEYASSMHGTNERIAVEDYADCIRFYIRLIEKTCGGSGEGA
jgi:carboxypeptidase PM20D1